MSTTGMNRFADTLKQLDQALTDWETLTLDPESPITGADPRVPKKVSPPARSETIDHARQILEKLRIQIEELGI